jgi:hypothetical protein
MRSKYTALAFLSVLLLVLSNQRRSVALVPSPTLRPGNVAEKLDTRNVVFGIPGVPSSERTLTVADRMSARLAPGIAKSGPGDARSQVENSGNSLPLAVDGEKNPERIPDSLAFRHFLSVTAINATATKHERGVRDAALALVQLSAEDRTAYLSAIGPLRDELTSIEQRRQRAAHDDAKSLNDLRIEQGRLLDDRAARAMASLSTEGAERLRQHINTRVKSRIKIYGEVIE